MVHSLNTSPPKPFWQHINYNITETLKSIGVGVLVFAVVATCVALIMGTLYAIYGIVWVSVWLYEYGSYAAIGIPFHILHPIMGGAEDGLGPS